MSAETNETVIFRRDQNGVVLRYYPDRLGAHHKQRVLHAPDSQRLALIKAERELVILEIIFDHLELSGVAQTRLADALNAIYKALELKRPKLGLSGGR